MMNLTTFPKVNSIYLNWGSSSPYIVSRRTGTDGEWETLATGVKTGYYEDTSALPGFFYYYRVTSGQTVLESEASTVLKETPFYGFVIESVPVNGNTVTNMARIWRKDTMSLLDPLEVVSIYYQPVETYDGRPVTDGVKKVTWGEVVPLNPAECLTSGLVLPNIWQYDDTGFNFSHTPPATTFEKPGHSYNLLMTDGTNLSIFFPSFKR